MTNTSNRRSPVGCLERTIGMSRACFHCGNTLETRSYHFYPRHRTTVNILLTSAELPCIPSTPSPEKRDNPRRLCKKCYSRCENQTEYAQVADERDASGTPGGKRRLFSRPEENLYKKPGRGKPPKNTADTFQVDNKNIETLTKSFMNNDRTESPGQLD